MEIKKIPKKVVTVLEPKSRLIVDKDKHRQRRVAAYCRVSTDSEEQLTSYETQMKVYTEMIAKNPEWCLAGIYADEGITGTLADKRPRFKKMIDDCLAGKIDYIIVKSVSRFARNTVDCLDYVRMLKARGIGVYFEEQNIDTLKSDSELYLIIYAGFAQSESESISKNITWSVRKNFEEGITHMSYKTTLGYRKGEDGEPEIVPEEAAVVERIFDMYLAGKTTREISEILQGENITFPKKKINLSRNAIVNILSNVRYIGDAILQKTITVDCINKVRKKNTGEAPMYYVQNSHPAIISREIYNKVQEEKARRNAKTPMSSKAITAVGKYSKYALTDVLICGECGTRYKRVTWNGQYKETRIVWRCHSRLDHGKKYCKTSPTVEENALKAAIVRALNRFNQEDESTYLSLMKATIGEAIGLNGNPEEIEFLERRIDALNKKMIDMVNAKVLNGGDIEEDEDDFKAIAEETERLKSRITVIKESMARDESQAERLAQISDIIEQREHNKDEYDDSIVRQMVECIKVYPDKTIEVIFGGGYSVKESL